MKYLKEYKNRKHQSEQKSITEHWKIEPLKQHKHTNWQVNRQLFSAKCQNIPTW